MSTWADTDDYSGATLTQTTPHGVFRAVIERDTYAEAPENDGGCPIVQIYARHYSFDAEMTGYGDGYDDGLPDTAAHIIQRFYDVTGRESDAIETFARYLRIFHGGAVMVREANGRDSDYTYVAYVTRGLREAWGAPEDTAPELDEYQAWIEGDVYSVAVERATDFNEDGEPETWDTIDGPVYGHYGEDHAKQAAEEELRYAVEQAGRDMLPLDL